MLYQIILATILGIFFGIFTGLIPGIHINLVSTMLLAVSPVLLTYTNTISLAVFIIAMSVTHSFLDVIPSTYLGAPDASNALMALPAHKMLLQGKAYEAIRLTVIGSLGCLILGVAIAPLMYLFVKSSYEFISKFMFWILMTAICFMVFKDKKRFYNLAVFLLAGSLGFVALNLPLIKDPLFPMLSGLFGTSILINSYFDKVNIPKQEYSYEKISVKEKLTGLTGGVLAGSLTSFMPGLGASQGAAIASSAFKSTQKAFMIMMGGINTVNFTLSIVTFYAIEKARNGSIIAASSLANFSLINVIMFLTIALITGAIATILCLNTTKVFGKIMQKVNYQVTVASVIILITVAVSILSNFYGVILLLAATSLGLITTKLGIAKNHLMGCLLIPVLIYFI